MRRNTCASFPRSRLMYSHISNLKRRVCLSRARRQGQAASRSPQEGRAWTPALGTGPWWTCSLVSGLGPLGRSDHQRACQTLAMAERRGHPQGRSGAKEPPHRASRDARLSTGYGGLTATGRRGPRREKMCESVSRVRGYDSRRDSSGSRTAPARSALTWNHVSFALVRHHPRLQLIARIADAEGAPARPGAYEPGPQLCRPSVFRRPRTVAWAA